jgi:serine/threonine protein kinase
VIGTSIGNYTVQRLIGEGGMGTVYLASHPGIRRLAAVKVLISRDVADPETVSRFLTEARAANAIRHPNIVDIYDSGIFENSRPYIVMEYLEGETLKQILGRGPVALDDVLDWGCQIADALTAAHDNYVVHRDLKPDNLFLVADPRRPGKKQVKVLDFGIAKLQQPEEGRDHQTQTGALLGTPLYMSPEQCMSMKDLDARSDIYSLGVILYEMVTARRPFDGSGMYAVMSMHINDQPVAPTTYRADLPRRIQDIIWQALAKPPAQRQGSMAEVLSQLELARGNVAASGEALKRLRPGSLKPASAVRTFGRDQILAFLREIDSMLDEPIPMEIIGGAAALLAYGAQTPTKDINTLSSIDERILRAGRLTTHKIPINPVVLTDVPRGYEDGRDRLDLSFRHLVIWVPDRYRLLLMKAVRAERSDVAVIEEMHTAKQFDMELVVDLFNDQTSISLGNLDTLNNVYFIIERLFGPNHVRRVGALTKR